MSESKTYCLMNEGKYVKVEQDGSEPKLYVVESQNAETVIILQRRCKTAPGKQTADCSNGNVEMAFQFPDSEKHFSPKVEKNTLKLLEWSDSQAMPDSHWFKRINNGSGDLYLLESVVSPQRYICIKPNRSLELGQSPNESDRVSHSRVN